MLHDTIGDCRWRNAMTTPVGHLYQLDEETPVRGDVTASHFDDEVEYTDRRQVVGADYVLDIRPYALCSCEALLVCLWLFGKHSRAGENNDQVGEALGRLAEKIAVALLVESRCGNLDQAAVQEVWPPRWLCVERVQRSRRKVFGREQEADVVRGNRFCGLE